MSLNSKVSAGKGLHFKEDFSLIITMNYHEKRELEKIRTGFLPSVKGQNCCIQYENKTPRKVDVFVATYAGNIWKFRTLQPKENFHVTSTINFPWLFRDSKTHATLDVKFTQGSACLRSICAQSKDMPHRTAFLASITTPVVSSLQECAMRSILNTILHPNHVFRLKLPSVLQNELHRRFMISDYQTPQLFNDAALCCYKICR